MYYELGGRPRIRLAITPAREHHADGNSGNLSAQAAGQGHGEPTTVGLDDEKLGACQRSLVSRTWLRGKADDLAAVGSAHRLEQAAACRPHLDQRNQRRRRRPLRGP